MIKLKNMIMKDAAHEKRHLKFNKNEVTYDDEVGIIKAIHEDKLINDL